MTLVMSRSLRVHCKACTQKSLPEAQRTQAIESISQNISTRWPHLHWLQIWPPGGDTCIGCKFGPLCTTCSLPCHPPPLRTPKKARSSTADKYMQLFSHFGLYPCLQMSLLLCLRGAKLVQDSSRLWLRWML